jgi:dCTP deaminase
MNQGGILSDSAIRRAVECGDIEIDPFDPARLNPCSYDLTLGDEVEIYDQWTKFHSPYYQVSRGDWDNLGHDDREIDIREESKTVRFQIPQKAVGLAVNKGGIRLNPGVGYLMHTAERIHTKRYVPVLDGKSSVGRLFMQVHFTAGYGDAGFNGQYTLEVSVLHPLRIYAGMRIAQMRFHTIVGEVEKLYDGNYVKETATGPVASRAWKQFK